MMTEILASIDAPHFFAGIVLWDDRVVEAAPIVDYMKRQRWNRERVHDYCRTKRWKITIVHVIKRES